jgi:hypothetical protein
VVVVAPLVVAPVAVVIAIVVVIPDLGVLLLVVPLPVSLALRLGRSRRGQKERGYGEASQTIKRESHLFVS